jgi:glucose-1-phosphate cytidylyltransferase
LPIRLLDNCENQGVLLKTIILAGGMGTRLAEETAIVPKPLVEIGGKPILWHIMNIYGAHGYNEFVCALGYKAHLIKEYFLNFYALNNDLSIDLSNGKSTITEKLNLDWRVHLIDTGLNTMTGGRVGRLQQYVGNETFMLTYGDGVGDIDIKKLIAFHKSHGKLATVTAVRPPARFGELSFEGDRIAKFAEKPQTGEGWINGGFFVLEPKVFDYMSSDETVLEREPMEQLAADGQLMAFRHPGFWQPMDTIRDKKYLEGLWESGEAPWKVW